MGYDRIFTSNITRVMPMKLKIIPESNDKCNYYKGSKQQVDEINSVFNKLSVIAEL